MDSVFKYNIGDEPNPGIVITDCFISPVSGKPMYCINDYFTPFYEDEVEGMSKEV